MRRVLAFIAGVLSGGAMGTAAALLFTPRSGDSLRGSLGARWQAALRAGDEAAARKRAELQAQLIEMTGPHSADSPLLKLIQPPDDPASGPRR